MTPRRYLARAALALTLAAAACDSDTPTSPTEATPTATTETFTGTVQRRGATSRSFRTSAEGVITASLASLGQDGAQVSLALGLSDQTTGQCLPTYSVVTSVFAGRAISVKADAGQYCFMVTDIGEITNVASFEVTVTHF